MNHITQAQAVELALDAGMATEGVVGAKVQELCNAAIEWYSKQQALVVGTSMEDMRRAGYQAVKEPIYYMRDNHTFKKLSEDVPTALVEIESELNAGYTSGMLCSKRDGFENIHSHHKERMKFLNACKDRLEAISLPALNDRLVQLALQELYEFQEATGCDCAAEFRATNMTPTKEYT